MGLIKEFLKSPELKRSSFLVSVFAVIALASLFGAQLVAQSQTQNNPGVVQLETGKPADDLSSPSPSVSPSDTPSPTVTPDPSQSASGGVGLEGVVPATPSNTDPTLDTSPSPTPNPQVSPEPTPVPIPAQSNQLNITNGEGCSVGSLGDMSQTQNCN